MNSLSVIRSCHREPAPFQREDLAHLEWIEVPSHGHVSRARNEGARRARAEWLLFVDEDCEITSSVIERIHAQLHWRKQPDVIWGANYSRQIEGTLYARSYNWIQRSWVLLSRTENAPSPRAHNLLGGFLLLHRDLFGKLEGFDEQIPWAGEETDFLRRAQALGFTTCLLENLEITHKKNLRAAGFFRRAWKQGLSRGRHGLATPGLTLSTLWNRRAESDGLSFAEFAGVLAFGAVMRLGSLLGRWTKSRA